MEQHPHKGICCASVLVRQVTSAGIAYAKFSVPKLSQPPIKKYVIHPNLGNQEQMVLCRMGSHHSFIILCPTKPIHYLLGNRILLMA